MTIAEITTHSELLSACRNGLIFLHNTAIATGWEDFHTRRSGRSTQWVTAYVLANLPKRFPEPAISLFNDVKSNRGRLGYNNSVPPDTDSSALGMLAIRRNGFNPSTRVLNGFSAFVEKHIICGAKSGFSTYDPSSEIVAYKGNTPESFNGWCKTPVDEITAVIATVVSVVGPAKFSSRLLDTLDRWLVELAECGLPEPYWWTGKWYLYNCLSEALLSYRPSDSAPYSARNRSLVAITRSWEQERINVGMEPFELSCFLLVGIRLYRAGLITGPSIVYEQFFASVHSTMRELLSHQAPNGAWQSKAILRIPFPWDCAPWDSVYFNRKIPGTGGLHGDLGIFSTATAVRALEEAALLKVEL